VLFGSRIIGGAVDGNWSPVPIWGVGRVLEPEAGRFRGPSGRLSAHPFALNVNSLDGAYAGRVAQDLGRSWGRVTARYVPRRHESNHEMA